MVDPLTRFLDIAGLGIRAQAVVALRAIRFAEGGPAAFSEAQRMVAEKMMAAFAGEMAAAAALLGGASFDDAAAQAMVPVRRCVEDNVRRLSLGQP